jgi:predicted Zn finger-like uncharacterized protein
LYLHQHVIDSNASAMSTPGAKQTRCPACSTVFAVTDKLLSAASGQVRCGQCQSVFNARQHMLDDDHDSTIGLGKEPVDNDIQPPSLRSDILDETVESSDEPQISAPDLGDWTPESDEPDRETAEATADLFSGHAVTGTDEESAPADKDSGTAEKPTTESSIQLPDIPFELQDDMAAKARGPDRSGLLWGSSIFLAAILLGGQFVWFQRNSLADSPDVRPWVETFCRYLGCKLEPPSLPGRIRILSRSVTDHPDHKNALLLHLTLINLAERKQAWPVLELTLKNNRRFRAMRRFTVDEYLPATTRQAGFPPNTPIQLTLEIQRPSKFVSDFEIAFRKP